MPNRSVTWTPSVSGLGSENVTVASPVLGPACTFSAGAGGANQARKPKQANSATGYLADEASLDRRSRIDHSGAPQGRVFCLPEASMAIPSSLATILCV